MEEKYTKETIRKNYQAIIDSIENLKEKKGILTNVKIVAVTKTHPIEAILNAADAGITDFGENYAQELKAKYELVNQSLSKQVNWHFIGHLQTNKVKYIAPFVSLIHSVDSVHLAKEIEKQAEKNNKTIDILIQVNTSGEASKFGCSPELTCELINEIKDLQNLRIRGLMTIGSFSLDEKVIRKEFQLLKSLFEEARKSFPNLPLNELSMGMTNDYLIAVEEGATILRIGTAIFGERNYP
ncbi:MAG: YggS family pyridoxal phosphate-dependent enzyme [Ignavibacteria bacterium]|nr:YggS family pyridoxal phosphate-dependent enzyme [Ignavibacteria bacterium]